MINDRVDSGVNNSTLTVNALYIMFIKKWLVAAIVSLSLNVAIGYTIALATNTLRSFSDVMGYVTILPYILYVLIIVASILIAGKNIRAGILSIVLIVYAATQPATTLASFVAPGSMVPIIIFALGLLAGLQIIKDLYIRFTNKVDVSRLSTPAYLVCISFVIMSFLLSSRHIFNILYPLL